ncbi:MAG: hypothetical protein CFE44_18195 [Burkholderiales bacterium PBB4]|nr:MAG: hypothetical protein CFE44_18195 [Burkholderiales bacterium PBB4]
MKKSTFFEAGFMAGCVKPLFATQLALQVLDLHSTLAHISFRGEMNKAIVAIGDVIGMVPAVVLMKFLSVAAICLLYKQWKKLPKGNVFDAPVVVAFSLLNLILAAIILNNYWG